MQKARIKRFFIGAAGIVLTAVVLLMIPACVPTYSKEKLPEAVKSVCKKEYDMDVEVKVVGNTMSIYYPMKGLLDAGMGISKEAWDSISNLILIASRVVLSTDADIEFYCVITQDARLPELQVVIIKYVDDVKRGMYLDISRGESFKRTLFSINLTPQAKKERSIGKVFDKLGVEDETRQKVLDEFFRSPPTRLSDFGYWRGNFYLKNISMEEFLVAQIANRIKVDFRGEKKLTKLFDYQFSDGMLVSSEEGISILLKFKIFEKGPEGELTDLRAEKIEKIIRVANEVIYGYKFKDFDFLELEDQLENVKLRISMQDVYDFRKKRLTVEDIVQGADGYLAK